MRVMQQAGLKAAASGSRALEVAPDDRALLSDGTAGAVVP